MNDDDDFESPQWSLLQEKRKGAENHEVTSNFLYMKKDILANYVTDNIKSADFKWSLFCAACNSYRFDSVLRPFPPFFIHGEDVKQIDTLREVIRSCPPMNILPKQLIENKIPSVLVDLLYWVLVQLNEPSLKFIPKEEHQSIISQVPCAMKVTMPDYMFRVTYSDRHEQKFSSFASNHATKLAFHGSRLDNFYSILNFGLQVSFNKVAAFGPGIYLSSEMGISLSYSPRGFTWISSLFGSHISIIALCEVIDHPEVRSEKQTKKCNNINFSIFDNQSVPGTYFIVENNDLVCVRYLLVYSSNEVSLFEYYGSATLFHYIRRHKMLTFAIGYIILLLAIGSSNASFFYKFWKRLLRRFHDIPWW